ncbi:MAG: hypothetical protein CMP48_08640 [Rickettsiales bacterium]|nr:hypothetical protein [Rickettsiales bacterium]|tara:strand:- start:108 stop:305 length:198 start_codon:yes stop_codon:yes gene_type:complete
MTLKGKESIPHTMVNIAFRVKPTILKGRSISQKKAKIKNNPMASGADSVKRIHQSNMTIIVRMHY